MGPLYRPKAAVAVETMGSAKYPSGLCGECLELAHEMNNSAAENRHFAVPG
jgi:hypothetical protein